MIHNYDRLMSSSIIKETERINKLFKPYADSFLKIQSQLDSSLYSSVLEAQRHIETTVAGTLQRFREQFKMSCVDSAQKTYEKLEASLRPFQQLQSRIDSSLHSSILEAHRQLETTVAGTAARLHDQLAGSWAEQIRQVQDSLRKSINVALLHENMELINDSVDLLSSQKN